MNNEYESIEKRANTNDLGALEQPTYQWGDRVEIEDFDLFATLPKRPHHLRPDLEALWDEYEHIDERA
jgi:hypothetical protein